MLNIRKETLSPGLDASAKAVTEQYRRQQQVSTDEGYSDKCKTDPFQEHNQIVLTTEVLGDNGTELKPGDVGTVVCVHLGDEAFVVEFMALDGDTLAIATVLPSQARPISGADMTHSRSVEATA